jgi:hypothetical protein
VESLLLLAGQWRTKPIQCYRHSALSRLCRVAGREAALESEAFKFVRILTKSKVLHPQIFICTVHQPRRKSGIEPPSEISRHHDPEDRSILVSDFIAEDEIELNRTI